ncbi:MAG: hypothetical protein GXO86_04645 [Chlorobi bacterium]|nr:hypothetical protein [Chlorobiota bacterium]
MTNEILIFSTVRQAKAILTSFSENFVFPTNDFKKEELIKYTVQSSVYRALPSKPFKPSYVYREWFRNRFDNYINDMQNIQSQSGYTDFVFHYTNSLINYWDNKYQKSILKIGYGPASKIINLIGKMVNESMYFDTKNIEHLLHVPFDVFSLKPLTSIINELTNVRYKITIPRSPSMKYILNKEHYVTVQTAVFNLCEIAGIKPIVYDYWCWNRTH